MILKWPGIERDQCKQYDAKHYQIDITASILEMMGVRVPDLWDGESFAKQLLKGEDEGRSYLVVSQGAWTCQRGVRWGDHLLIDTMHDGYHLYDDVMLFDLAKDPHETSNLAKVNQEKLDEGQALLGSWLGENMPLAARGRDPLRNVVAEGGPFHVRGKLPDYLKRLRSTGRNSAADALEKKVYS
jgi:arylsulfatase A-like enzyme